MKARFALTRIKPEPPIYQTGSLCSIWDVCPLIRKTIPAVLVGQGSLCQSAFSLLQLWHVQAAALGRWGRSRITSPAGKPQPKPQTPAAASQAVKHELPSFATRGNGVKWLQFQQSLVHLAIIHGSSAAAAWMAEPSLQKVLGVFPTVWKQAGHQKSQYCPIPKSQDGTSPFTRWHRTQKVTGEKKSDIYIGKQRKICNNHDQGYQVCTCPRWQKPKPICVKGKWAWITDIFSWKLRLWKE